MLNNKEERLNDLIDLMTSLEEDYGGKHEMLSAVGRLYSKRDKQATYDRVRAECLAKMKCHGTSARDALEIAAALHESDAEGYWRKVVSTLEEGGYEINRSSLITDMNDSLQAQYRINALTPDGETERHAVERLKAKVKAEATGEMDQVKPKEVKKGDMLLRMDASYPSITWSKVAYVRVSGGAYVRLGLDDGSVVNLEPGSSVIVYRPAA